MKKIYLVLFLAVIFVNMGMPTESKAYVPTEETAVRINENTLLYTITYRFSFLDRAIRMPIATKRSLEYGATSPDVGYELFAKDGTVFTGGIANGLVLSTADIHGTEYYVPTSKAEYFTLVALLTVPDEMKESAKHDGGLQLRVTTLPFSLIKSGKEERSLLDTKQLELYQTPFISL